jgi:hypothetical protein
MGSPVGCTGYTAEGMCRQAFSFQGKQADGAQLKSCSVERGSHSLSYTGCGVQCMWARGPSSVTSATGLRSVSSFTFESSITIQCFTKQ